MKLPAQNALQNRTINLSRQYPGRTDPRFSNNMLIPNISPKFQLSTPCKIFTIGSCFARNIEEALSNVDIELPTKRFSAPKSEWPNRSNGLLNEYNPGKISQRILSALNQEPDPDETIIAGEAGYIDLLLPYGPTVSYERAKERRREINDVYRDLKSSDLVIITLGFIESWYDNLTEMFLNRMPPDQAIHKQPERFIFHRLSMPEAYSLLKKAMATMVSAGISNIILTVSPVPFGATFTACDAIVANSYSKSVLRVCAENLKDNFPQVDYFPSYEIITNCGLNAYMEDNKHIKDEMVRLVTKIMLDSYLISKGNECKELKEVKR